MHAKILKFSIIAALAGFLFGFDTVVISGADKKLQAPMGIFGQFSRLGSHGNGPLGNGYRRAFWRIPHR